MVILDFLTGNPSQESVFTVSVIIGMIGHYAKKRVKSETQVTLKQWFMELDMFGSIASVVTALVIILGAFANHIITPDMSTLTVFYIGLISGFTVDSVTNSDGSGAANVLPRR
jgi:hypothetical protein